mgnify:FL=1
MPERNLQDKMMFVLKKLGLDYDVIMTPKENDKHGEIDKHSKTILIYDQNEKEAWQTFKHELIEISMINAFKIYREATNALIEVIDKIAYGEKEKAIQNAVRYVEEACLHDANPKT